MSKRVQVCQITEHLGFEAGSRKSQMFSNLFLWILPGRSRTDSRGPWESMERRMTHEDLHFDKQETAGNRWGGGFSPELGK
jgi:hypothetical protein